MRGTDMSHLINAFMAHLGWSLATWTLRALVLLAITWGAFTTARASVRRLFKRSGGAR